MTSFMEAVSAITASSLLEKRAGVDHVPWASALSLAGRPRQAIVIFPGDKPVLEVLGGAIVAVDMAVGSQAMNDDSVIQRTYLCVLDDDNNPVSPAELTPTLISDSWNKCRARAVALVTGHTLSVHAGYGGDAATFVRDVNVHSASCQPVECLQKVAVTNGDACRNGGLPWAIALAAARITDPSFHWAVMHYDHATSGAALGGRLPYLASAGGYFVAIAVTWRGQTHTEILPLLAQGDVPAPAARPSVADWDRAVMTCLAKAVAVVTGYGLSLYGGMGSHGSAPTSSAQSRQVTSSVNGERAALLDEMAAILLHEGRTVAVVANWLGFPKAQKLEDLPTEALLRGVKAMQSKVLT